MNSPIFCSRLSQDNVDAEGTDVACVISVRHGSDQQIHGSPNEKSWKCSLNKMKHQIYHLVICHIADWNIHSKWSFSSLGKSNLFRLGPWLQFASSSLCNSHNQRVKSINIPLFTIKSPLNHQDLIGLRMAAKRWDFERLEWRPRLCRQQYHSIYVYIYIYG